MATFPLLNSGAVAQYPLPLTFQGTAQVIPFLDGTDQRFIRQARALRAWEIQLGLLNDSEIKQLELFFESMEGQYQAFDFPDPYSGATVPNCRFSAADFVATYLNLEISSTSVWVLETNG